MIFQTFALFLKTAMAFFVKHGEMGGGGNLYTGWRKKRLTDEDFVHCPENICRSRGTDELF
jgi:hypothetical protein